MFSKRSWKTQHILLLAILVLLFLFWTRGQEEVDIFEPPDIPPGVVFQEAQEASLYDVHLQVSSRREDEDHLLYQWTFEIIPKAEGTEDFQMYAALPRALKPHIVPEDTFDVYTLWFHEGIAEIESLSEHGRQYTIQRLLHVEEEEKDRVEALARWVRLIIHWEEGEEYLEFNATGTILP